MSSLFLTFFLFFFFFFFFFNDTATTEIYTLSLHDVLPICFTWARSPARWSSPSAAPPTWKNSRSEEHTSELQSPYELVCRHLLEKKKKAYEQALQSFQNSKEAIDSSSAQTN